MNADSEGTGASDESTDPPGPRGDANFHLTVDERRRHGLAARKLAPRASHGAWTPPPDRPDPLDLLRSQARTRLAPLVPIRYGRMLVSPLAFLRGSAIVMAQDLAGTPVSGIQVQLCGDAHLSNFGFYGTPERNMLFDINDFDETLAGPFEWDVKRLAASVVVASRQNGLGTAVCRDAGLAVTRAYRLKMAEFAEMKTLDIWYAHVAASALPDLTSDPAVKKSVRKVVTKARDRDHLTDFAKLTEVVEGRRRIVNRPPLIERILVDDVESWVRATYHAYRMTLQDDRRHLLERYRFVDVARKTVGVGSVGTRCFIVLLEGRDGNDPIFLQAKEAGPSVLEAHLPKSQYKNHGQRVVNGQRFMQAASDLFLGWIPGDEVGRDYYWRQLRDMKGSVEIEELAARDMINYANLCGWALARAHARSGDPVQIASYLGETDRFEEAIANFAVLYADQTERDHESLVDAVAGGRIDALSGV